MGWDRPILTDSGGFQVVSLGDLRVDRRRRRDVQEPPRRLDPPVHAGALDRGPAGARRRRRGRVRPAGLPELVARGRRGRHGADPSLGGAVARAPTPRPTRRCSASSRAASTRSSARESDAVHRRAAVRRHQHRRPRRRRDAGAAQRDARRHDPAPRRRPAAALPDGPRLAARPARRRPPRHRPVRLRAAGAGRPQRPAVGPRRPAQPPQRSSSATIRGRSRTAARASLCRRFSRAYLAHLFRAKEMLAYRLATCHNLTFTLDFMARIRAAIRAGTFPAETAGLRSARRPDEWR